MGGVGVRTHFNDNDQGTLADSTVTGVPATLLSNGIPAEISMINGQANEEGINGANGKCFKIFVLPARDESFVSFCFQLI
jgi:hypothetical protein